MQNDIVLQDLNQVQFMLSLNLVHVKLTSKTSVFSDETNVCISFDPFTNETNPTIWAASLVEINEISPLRQFPSKHICLSKLTTGRESEIQMRPLDMYPSAFEYFPFLPLPFLIEHKS